VIQADGGTRTASVTGAFVALYDAATKLMDKQVIQQWPISDFVAAVSIGVVQGKPLVDLDYAEDSSCDTDMNVVMTGRGGLVEVQGTAEGAPFSRAVLNQMMELAEHAILELVEIQKKALAA
jgi:ribonuclease PH